MLLVQLLTASPRAAAPPCSKKLKWYALCPVVDSINHSSLVEVRRVWCGGAAQRGCARRPLALPPCGQQPRRRARQATPGRAGKSRPVRQRLTS